MPGAWYCLQSWFNFWHVNTYKVGKLETVEIEFENKVLKTEIAN